MSQRGCDSQSGTVQARKEQKRKPLTAEFAEMAQRSQRKALRNPRESSASLRLRAFLFSPKPNPKITSAQVATRRHVIARHGSAGWVVEMIWVPQGRAHPQ